MGKIREKLLIILLIIVIAGAIFIPKVRTTYFPFTTLKKAESMTQEKYLDDLDYLNQLIIEHYSYLELANNQFGIDWDREYKKTKMQMVEVHTDKEFEVILGELLKKLSNGHTHLITDGIDLAYLHYLYSSIPYNGYKKVVSSFRNANTIARYELNNEYIKEFREMGIDNVISKDQSDNFTSEILIPGKVAYGHVKQLLSDVDGEIYQRDVDNIKEFVQEYKDYPIFILDIRGNGGGNSSYWQRMLLPQLIEEGATMKFSTFLKDGPLFPKKLKKLYKEVKTLQETDKERIFGNYPLETMELVRDFPLVHTSQLSVISLPEEHFIGKLYLLVDKNVYSSSEMLAAFCSQTGAATLVGERTGGDGIGTGPLFAVLPHSGLVVSLAKDFGVLSNGSINERDQTTPDYVVENAERKEEYDVDGNWKYQDDKCIQKVFELENITEMIPR